MPSRSTPPRRGIAMMLVLISVALATILASAYLASRDNSLVIGQNSTAAASSRWAAFSALETGVAILQTETDWRLNHTNGVLLDNYPLAGATITLTIRDLETDAPPTATSQFLEVTATAATDIDGDGRADGIQMASFEAFVPFVAGNQASVDLAEFAIYAHDEITLSDQATVARWSTSPLAGLGHRIALGIRATASASVEILDNAASLDTTVYHPPNASQTLVVNATGPPIEQIEMPFTMPFWLSPDHGEPDPGSPYPDLEPSSGANLTYNTDKRYDDIILENCTLTLSGDITLVADDLLEVDDNARLFIDGNVTIVCFGTLQVMDGAAIELLDGATLKIFVGDDILMRDGYIGDQRSDDSRDHTGYASYMDPMRVQIFSIDDTPSADRYWILWFNSVVKGTVYAPPALLRIFNDSAIYGRAAVENIRIQNNSGLFYDHSLDGHLGFTNVASAVFESGGNLDPDVLSISDLDPLSLQILADNMNTVIHANGLIVYPTGWTPTPPTPPGDPTPRTVAVEYHVTSFGAKTSVWESRATAAGAAVVDGGGTGKQQIN